MQCRYINIYDSVQLAECTSPPNDASNHRVEGMGYGTVSSQRFLNMFVKSTDHVSPIAFTLSSDNTRLLTPSRSFNPPDSGSRSS